MDVTLWLAVFGTPYVHSGKPCVHLLVEPSHWPKNPMVDCDENPVTIPDFVNTFLFIGGNTFFRNAGIGVCGMVFDVNLRCFLCKLREDAQGIVIA